MTKTALTHQDEDGRNRMVDVGDKPVTTRRAIARAVLHMSAEAFAGVRGGQGRKGDALQTAELAGIMAAKRTADLIPLCHPLPLSKVRVAIEALEGQTAFEIRAEVRTDGKTGVEMEALTAASIAGLTLYDMTKAIDKTMRLDAVEVIEKSGGRSGDIRRDQ